MSAAVLTPVGRRYRAPAAGGVLAEPPTAALPGLVARNRERLAESAVRLDGTRLSEFRALARAEVVTLARSYLARHGGGGGDPWPAPSPEVPLLLTGHQPELYHPGVWAKNFALNGLARRLGGVPLHLIVDNDTMKSVSIRQPTWPRGVRTRAHLETVPFDGDPAEVPYESRAVRDGGLFRGFPERARAGQGEWGFTPMLAEVWPTAVALEGCPVGERFSAMRRATERRWGCRNLELPVSWLARGDAFRRFAAHILADLPRFTDAYNRAIRDYRALNRVRSANHPAPELARRGGDWEAPFWRITAAGREKVFASAGVAPDFATLRPRALTLTLFARLALGDFFLHGIGGGKYDEVTDAIVADYFGLEAPAFQVLSATVPLPLAPLPTTRAGLAARERFERDAHWNPERYLPDSPPVAELARERTRLIAAEPARGPGSAAARREWFRQLRAIGDRLRGAAGDSIRAAGDDLALARAEAHANGVLSRRDFAWVLYPEATLRPAMQAFLTAGGPDDPAGKA